jgi:tRNA/rRNA methyltransferase
MSNPELAVNPSWGKRCRIVLVRPKIAANVGATARVMHNFGLTQLYLVAPHADPLDPEARKLSTHGERTLHAAQSVDGFEEAVGDCVLVVGTSARTGGAFRRQSVGTPRAILPHVVEAAARGPTALVFGPEQTGLTNAEVTHCHYLMTIPTAPTYPALNLAQAVAICLYELHVAGQAPTAPGPNRQVAPWDMQQRLFDRLAEALRRIHFLWGPNADALLHALRHLIGRAQPTAMEVDLLLGLARQILWYADRYGPKQKP